MIFKTEGKTVFPFNWWDLDIFALHNEGFYCVKAYKTSANHYAHPARLYTRTLLFRYCARVLTFICNMSIVLFNDMGDDWRYFMECMRPILVSASFYVYELTCFGSMLSGSLKFQKRRSYSRVKKMKLLLVNFAWSDIKYETHIASYFHFA